MFLETVATLFKGATVAARRLTIVGLLAGIFCVAIGAIMIAAWVLNPAMMAGSDRSLTGPMKANSAAAFIAIGFALSLHYQWPTKRRCHVALALLAIFVMGIGAATLIQDISGQNLGIDQLLVADPTLWEPGRMSVASAVNFVLVGIGLFALPSRRQLPVLIGQSLSLVVIVVSATAMLYHLFDLLGTSALHVFSRFSLLGGLTFVVTGIGLLFAQTDRGFVALVLRSRLHFTLAMGALLALIVAMFGMTWLQFLTEQPGGNVVALKAALLALAAISLLTAIITWTTSTVIDAETQREQALADVRRHRNWLDTTLSSIGDGVIATDVTGRVSFLNPVAEQLTGWSSREAAGQPLADVLCLADDLTDLPVDPTQAPQSAAVPELASAVRWVLKSRSGRRIPIAITISKGAQRPPSNTDAADTDADTEVGAVVVVRDVTDQRAAEMALQASEAQFRRLADSMPQLIWTATANGVVRYFNRQWGNYTGHTFETGAPFDDLREWAFAIPLKDREVMHEAWGNALRAPAGFDIEFQLRRDDGQMRWQLCRAIPVWNDSGELVEWIGSITDIHDQKLAQQQLKTFNESLEQRIAERTDEIQQLAVRLSETEQIERQRVAGILHDHLQQLLVATRIRVSLLRPKVPESAHGPIGQIDAMIAEVIAGMRSLAAQLSPAVLSEGGLPAALNWLASQMRTEQSFDAHLTVEPAGDEAWQKVDVHAADFLFHATRELLLNVMKHTNTLSADIHLALGTEHREIELAVTDDGPGCPPDAATRKTSGTGLGLIGLSERVRFLGGALAITSPAGRGCRVQISLPAHFRTAATA